MAKTLIDEFINLSVSSESSQWHSMECGEDKLTYAQLHTIAHGLAADSLLKYGVRPTVAIISENHPYTFAVILATWMLGGVVAPLDYHAPDVLMRGMLSAIEPACVVLPTSDIANCALVKG